MVSKQFNVESSVPSCGKHGKPFNAYGKCSSCSRSSNKRRRVEYWVGRGEPIVFVKAAEREPGGIRITTRVTASGDVTDGVGWGLRRSRWVSMEDHVSDFNLRVDSHHRKPVKFASFVTPGGFAVVTRVEAWSDQDVTVADGYFHDPSGYWRPLHKPVPPEGDFARFAVSRRRPRAFLGNRESDWGRF